MSYGCQFPIEKAKLHLLDLLQCLVVGKAGRILRDVELTFLEIFAEFPACKGPSSSMISASHKEEEMDDAGRGAGKNGISAIHTYIAQRRLLSVTIDRSRVSALKD